MTGQATQEAHNAITVTQPCVQDSAGSNVAERFIEDVRGDDPDLASYLRIGERELDAGGRN